MERKMEFNFDNPYIEYSSNELPYELYEIYGVRKINELSRQLQTFLNYKSATIQYRFRSKNLNLPIDKDIIYKELKGNLKSLAFRFIKLLRKIRGNGVSYEIEINKLLNRDSLRKDRLSKKLLTDLKDVTEKLFTIIHLLSDLEIHLHPKFLKFITNITQDMVLVFKIFNNWASSFYEELGTNYIHLHSELSTLITEEQAEKLPEKTSARKQRILEEGLKE